MLCLNFSVRKSGLIASRDKIIFNFPIVKIEGLARR